MLTEAFVRSVFTKHVCCVKHSSSRFGHAVVNKSDRTPALRELTFLVPPGPKLGPLLWGVHGAEGGGASHVKSQGQGVSERRTTGLEVPKRQSLRGFWELQEAEFTDPHPKENEPAFQLCSHSTVLASVRVCAIW